MRVRPAASELPKGVQGPAVPPGPYPTDQGYMPRGLSKKDPLVKRYPGLPAGVQGPGVPPGPYPTEKGYAPKGFAKHDPLVRQMSRPASKKPFVIEGFPITDRTGKLYEPARFEPHLLPLRVTDPRTGQFTNRRWLSPSKRGVPWYGPPTVTFARYLRCLTSVIFQLHRSILAIRNKHDLSLVTKDYHVVIRFLKRNGLSTVSANVQHWMRVVSVGLRLAKENTVLGIH